MLIIGLRFFLLEKFPLPTTIGLIIISLLICSCRNDHDRNFDARTYHKDLASLVERKYLNQADTILISKVISRSITRGADLRGFTYGSLKEKAFTLAEKASMDILIIKSCFEKERQNYNADSLIVAMNPAWFMNDTLKFYYTTLLINGIATDSKALGRIETAIGEMIPSEVLAKELIFNRLSFDSSPPFYEDDVADKKIIHLVFDGDRSLNGVIDMGIRETCIRNGWKIVEIP